MYAVAGSFLGEAFRLEYEREEDASFNKGFAICNIYK